MVSGHARLVSKTEQLKLLLNSVLHHLDIFISFWCLASAFLLPVLLLWLMLQDMLILSRDRYQLFPIIVCFGMLTLRYRILIGIIYLGISSIDNDFTSISVVILRHVL